MSTLHGEGRGKEGREEEEKERYGEGKQMDRVKKEETEEQRVYQEGDDC